MSQRWDPSTHYEEFKKEGFTILKEVYNAKTIQSVAAAFYQLREEKISLGGRGKNCHISNMIERRPQLFLPIMSNPIILDVVERIIGPFIQISDSVILGNDPISEEEAKGKVHGWHRDRYSEVPTEGVYHRPRGMNALCYLQDLTERTGPLRVIPYSHMRAMTLEDSERNVPHPEEIMPQIKAGDVVIFHNALLHSGSLNTSENMRIHMGGSYIPTWMKPFDNHNGPNALEFVRLAHEQNDHRMLRLFGVDNQMEMRVNCGFTQQDEVMWAEWAAEDMAAKNKGK